MKYILVATTEGELYMKPFRVRYYSVINEVVGGYFEIANQDYFEPKFELVVNGEGKLKGLPFNALASILYGANIVGDVCFVESGLVGGEVDWVGSSKEELKKLGDYFISVLGNYLSSVGYGLKWRENIYG